MERKNGDRTIKGTRQIFENEFLKFSEDQVIQPDGKHGAFATVEFIEGSAVEDHQNDLGGRR